MDVLSKFHHCIFIGCVGIGNLYFYFIDRWIKRNNIQNLSTSRGPCF